ncbi:MAG: VOC family protein [Candidatus Daviesbacteria bacterium]|nr:VOC family protein [Candidatus Daviesbacteria bacterium]
MIKGLESILLFSEDARKLADFYKDKVGLKMTMEAEVGESEDFFGFEFEGGPGLYIMHHSKVKGSSKEPERIMFNLEVSDIEEDVKRLDDAGVKKIQDTYHMESYGYIATFEDIDGNYFQLVQIRASDS